LIKAGERIRRWKHAFEVDLLFAVWTCLLLANDAPATDAEFMESESAEVKSSLQMQNTADTSTLAAVSHLMFGGSLPCSCPPPPVLGYPDAIHNA